jgi:hypothetical protein
MYLVATSETSTAARVISGRSLVHRHLSPRQRAAIVASVLAGEAVLKLSARQLAAVLGTHQTYIRAASKLASAKRRAVADGNDLTSFAALLKPALPAPRIADDSDVRRIA